MEEQEQKVEGKMEEQEQRVQRMEEKMEEREQRVGEVEERLMEVEKEMTEMKTGCVQAPVMREGELTKEENCLEVLKPINSFRTDILPTELTDEVDYIQWLI